MRFLIIINIIYIFSTSYCSTPINLSLSYQGGYDNNVMRFSKKEISDASSNLKYLGGSKTFDSYVNKIQFGFDKTLYAKNKKEVIYNSSVALSDYVHNSNKDYWSGNISVKYKWGSYRNLKYSLRHLNSYYLRHYIDRDLSLNDLKPCSFTDNDQYLSISNRINKKNWYIISLGFLQRYYDNPFTEFDLNIYYTKVRINKKINKYGTISFQINRSVADNVTFTKTGISSDFDRSYESIEWYMPIKINSPIAIVENFGISFRQELRYYNAEAVNDVLHAGRDHVDNKLDIWFNKSLRENLDIVISARFRSRETGSSYSWVRDLKSFKQMQLWCKIKWGLSYDKY